MEIASIVTIALLGSALSFACVLSVWLSFRVVTSYQKTLSEVTSLAMRLSVDERDYALKAMADAEAAGRATTGLKIEQNQNVKERSFAKETMAATAAMQQRNIAAEAQAVFNS
ncbi:MAG: hypothetical protein IMZ57_04050 [Acidobacteria bacterium]|nr:hypothetical protein [Acidobacteriota bacterium]